VTVAAELLDDARPGRVPLHQDLDGRILLDRGAHERQHAAAGAQHECAAARGGDQRRGPPGCECPVFRVVWERQVVWQIEAGVLLVVEGRADSDLLGTQQAEPLPEVREITADGQGGGDEDRG
jgi:hypothetical protein